MARTVAHVLYENARNTTTRQFALHDLVCACVADARPPATVYQVRERVVGNPRKGAEKVLATLASDIDDLRAGGALVIAVLDADRIREKLKLPPDACRAIVVSAVRARAQVPAEGLEVVLLERNLESLLEAIAQRVPEARDAAETAIARKEHLARDRALSTAAYRATKDARDAVLDDMPSARRIVVAIARALTAAQR